MSAVGRWGKRPTFFGPPVSFKDFCVTIGVGSSGYSGMEHFGILKLDFFWKCFFFWSVSWTCGTKQNEYQKSTSSPTPPKKMPEHRLQNAWNCEDVWNILKKSFFHISLEQQLPISPKKSGSSFASRGLGSHFFDNRRPCLTFNGCCVAILVLTLGGGWTTFGSIRENQGVFSKFWVKKRSIDTIKYERALDPNSELFFLESTSTSPCSFVAQKHKAWSCFRTSLVQHYEPWSHPTEAKASRMASPSLFLTTNTCPPHHPPKIFVFSFVLNLRVIVAEPLDSGCSPKEMHVALTRPDPLRSPK